MTSECLICGKPLEDASEIESGTCFDHNDLSGMHDTDSTIEPLDFEEEPYYGTTDSGRIDDGC